ncbi:MAG: hypothetical protein PHY09_12200 [Desulfuromonadaceae bacterium]|nr:hypothetical protein [Desulfuromonadaceae bacterium]MDD5107652.1 hypothetical protein [Desulfuromonadaceae bacterium]
MNNNLKRSVLQWIKLSDKELDSRIADYIESNKLDFITATDEIYHRTEIIDGSILNRLFDSFIRLASKYIDDKTKCTIRKWEQMSDADIEQELLEMFRISGDAEIGRLFKFIDTKDMSTRAEKILLNAAPKMRHIKLLEMLDKWKSLSDDDLLNEVATELVGTGWNSSGSHFTFVNELYPSIQDDTLRHRVVNALFAMAEPAQFDENAMEKCGRALYACAKLKIPGTQEKLAAILQRIKDPSDMSYSTLIHWVNDALQDCPIPEAEKYLVKQLESVPEGWSDLISSPELPYLQRGQYVTFLTAHKALNSISKKLADKFAKILKLHH